MPDAPPRPTPGRARGQAGLTLIELMVAMAVLAIVTAIVGPTLAALSQSASTTDKVTTVNTAVGPALHLLTDQVEAASKVYSPCSSAGNAGTLPACTSGTTPAGFAILLFTQTTSGANRCSQWRVYDGLLQDRTWDPSVYSSSSTTTIPFEDATTGLTIANTTTSSPSPQQPPFTVESTGGVEANLVEIDLHVATTSGGPTVEISTAAGAQGLVSNPACSPPPSGSA